ncbi:hypothetical protein DITRI_Ditri03aG0097900 [Diplodiscus trichospermus]
MDRVAKLVYKNPVVIFSKSSCCICHSIKTLFYGLGANPTIHDLDQDERGKEMEQALTKLGCNPPVPTVFIGGKFVGPANKILALHVDGSLKNLLKNAGAIWF